MRIFCWFMSRDGNLRLVTSNLWVLVMLALQAFTLSINGVAAPWIMQSFHLNQSSLARLFAYISVSSIGALILTRLFDVIGRRRVLRWCVIASSFGAIGAALSRSLMAFTLCEILLNAAASAAIAAAIVVLAEKLPAAERATGQSLVGIAVRVGSGFGVALMPLLAYAGYSWRWLLVLAALPNLGLHLIDGTRDEISEWQPAAANRHRAGNALSDLLRLRYRRRAITLIVSTLLSSIAITSSKSWIYFHTVSIVGTPPAAASVMLLIAGGLALTGYPLGAASCERFGRVPTVSGFALLLAIGTVWSFLGPPSTFRHPLLWLGAGFACFGMATNATSVGANSSATELIPSGLRATMIGCLVLVGAMGQVTGQSIVAALAPRLGGVSNVVGYLGLLAIGVSLLFGFLIEESRGLALEEIAAD
jgi:MFS family permease